MNSDLFYRHYDDLYFSKNYKEEVIAILKIVEKYYRRRTRKMLEIGAGTGNHTMEFAQLGISVTAIDTDGKMVRLAKNKLSEFSNVKLLNSPAGKLKEKNFDFAIAGFNVINYLDNFNALDSFFATISDKLNPGGLLIFDCWNGIAAIADPPGSKVINTRCGDKFIQCVIKSENHLMEQKTTLDYRITLSDKSGNEIESGSYSFDQKLWTPFEIENSIRLAGLEMKVRCRPFQPETSAGENDWKMMYVCRKKENHR